MFSEAPQKWVQAARMLLGPRSARRYLHPQLSVEGFFTELRQRQARYLVLRWFEQLPLVEPGEDLDILIADEDLPLVQDLFIAVPLGVQCDVYSAGGLPGSDFRGMPYYPPYLANMMLSRPQHLERGFPVPCPEDYFFSLAYHAVYHKGPAAGLPTRTPSLVPALDPEHDYAAKLAALAEQCGIQTRLDIESLDLLLAEHGWRPPRDTLARLAGSNLWIKQSFFARTEPPVPERQGLTIFVLRQHAVELGLDQLILDVLNRAGFQLLAVKHLNQDEMCRCARRMRGGNWGRGAYAISGGDPKIVVATCDLIPLPVSRKIASNQPQVDNERIVIVKKYIRQALRQSLPSDKQCNMIHSSDNVAEAWEYLQLAMPEQQPHIIAQLAKLHQRFNIPVESIKNLTKHGNRARLDLIDFHGRLAVRKTFRPGYEHLAKREAFVMREFGQLRSELPELLDAGENYVVSRFYNDDFKKRCFLGRIMPIAVARQVIDVLRFFHDRGYALLDFNVGGILLDPEEGLKVVDFEFLHKYEIQPRSLEACYVISGLPEWFNGDRPMFSYSLNDRPYDKMLRPYIGLSIESLLYDPPLLQHIKRVLYFAWFGPSRVVCRVWWRITKSLSDKGLSRWNRL